LRGESNKDWYYEVVLQTVVFGMGRMRAFAAWACAQRLFIVIRPALLFQQV
jgi:hypothetical protein